MSQRKRTLEDEEGTGCLFLAGAIIVAICVGTITNAILGWLVLGIFLMAMACL